MKVGVPTEIKTDEYRVALTPSGVRELVEHGHEVVVQAGAGEGSAISDADYAEQGAEILPDAAAVFGAADMIVKVKEPQAPEVALLEPRHTLFTYLHLAPDPELTAGPRGLRRDLRRLRDRRGRARPAPAAGADERGGGQDRHAGRRVHAREAARRPRDPARRRARRGGRERDGHRRRRGRHERGLHRDRHGGDGLRLRPQHRPPARARHRLRRPRGHVLRVDAGHREAPARRRPRDRRGARPRRQGAVRDPARAAEADEEGRRDRRRLDRPGRLLRDLARRRRTRTRPTRSTASRTTAWPTCPARCRSPRPTR